MKLLVASLLLANTGFCQPYYFFTRPVDERSNLDALSLNPATALSELFVSDTIFFDAGSGNYVVRYLTQLKYIVGPNGTKPYHRDEPMLPGERIVKRDSMVSIILEPATKINPSVTCMVRREGETKSLLFSYLVTNQITSVQPLNEFSVDFDGNAEVTDSTPANGWHSLRADDVQNQQLVPGDTWRWFGDIGLGWGRSWVVGALQSKGLPSINRCKLSSSIWGC